MKLVVTQAFGEYQPGDEISDSKTIEAVLESNPASVVKVASEEPTRTRTFPPASKSD